MLSLLMPKCDGCGLVKPAADFPSRKNTRGQIVLKSPCLKCTNMRWGKSAPEVRRPRFLSSESREALEDLLLRSSNLRAAILVKLELKDELTLGEIHLRRDLQKRPEHCSENCK